MPQGPLIEEDYSLTMVFTTAFPSLISSRVTIRRTVSPWQTSKKNPFVLILVHCLLALGNPQGLGCTSSVLGKLVHNSGCDRLVGFVGSPDGNLRKVEGAQHGACAESLFVFAEGEEHYFCQYSCYICDLSIIIKAFVKFCNNALKSQIRSCH